MRSHILGKIDFDDSRLEVDLRYLGEVKWVPEEYDEFSSGIWQNIALRNASGDVDDGLFRDVEGPAQLTEHGKRLSYLGELVDELFDTTRITMVRTRNLVDGIVVPHRDFVELERDVSAYFRILICLQSNAAAFHSEEEGAISMRAGEIWYLDASAVHSAVNFSADSRQLMCLDFAFDDAYIESDVFRDQSIYRPHLEPLRATRAPFDAAARSSLLELAGTLNRGGFKELVFLVAKLHFVYDISATEVYDLIDEITETAGDAHLRRKSAELREYMTGNRSLGERFTLNAWDVPASVGGER